MSLAIKNWHKFQHFRDRRPPWIKLYRDILDDPDWHALDPVLAKTLVMLWLIASEDNGVIPDCHRLAFRLRQRLDTTEQQLIGLKQWLVQSDIASISDRYQDDTPETERETEKESHQPRACAPEGQAPKPAAVVPFVPYPKAEDDVAAEAQRQGCAAFDAVGFFGHYSAIGWKTGGGVPILDWRRLVRKWHAGQRTTTGTAAGRGGDGLSLAVMEQVMAESRREKEATR